MFDFTWPIYAILPLTVAFLVLGVGILAVRKGKEKNIKWVFGAFCVCVFTWAGGYSLMYASKTPEQALFWARNG
ncbi:hypothetical protein ACFL57_05045, partial [Candidatus Margulisiibacteriota bacterium]